MNPGALTILKKLGLKTPLIYSYDDVCNAPNTKTFYIRFSSESDQRSRLMNAAQIRTAANEISKWIDDGSLLHFEETVRPLLGGATLCQPSFLYTEVVVGHPISLLRRGVCGARILQSPTILFVEPVFQGWTAVQNHTYIWEPSSGPTDFQVRELVNCIGRLVLDIKQHPTLVEWMLTASGLIFFDARDAGFEKFGVSLIRLSEPDLIIVQRNSSLLDHRFTGVDGFDVDNRQPAREHTTIAAYNGALLSHYVTRCRDRAVNIILNRVNHA